MILEDVDKLPLLIRRADVARMTGWNDELITAYVNSGVLKRVARPGSRKGNFRKYEVLEVAGLPYDSSGRVIRIKPDAKAHLN